MLDQHSTVMLQCDDQWMLLNMLIHIAINTTEGHHSQVGSQTWGSGSRGNTNALVSKYHYFGRGGGGGDGTLSLECSESVKRPQPT